MSDDISFGGSLPNEVGKAVNNFVKEHPEVIAPVVAPVAAAAEPIAEGAKSAFEVAKGFVLGLFGIDDGG